VKELDRQTFATVMAQTFSVYGVTVTETMLSAWWATLEPYNMQAVTAAFSHHIGDYVGHGYRAPTPADIRRILEETLPALVRQRSAFILAEAREQTALYRERIATLRSEVTLGLTTEDMANELTVPLLDRIREVYAQPHVQQAMRGVSMLEEGHANGGYDRMVGPIKRYISSMLRGPTK
jgi:hypothetical protein